MNQDGSISAKYIIDDCYQGYPGIAQGGIIATLLDSAMTNCLFCRGICAMTAQLNIRYRKPVKVGQPLTVEAVLRNKHGRLYELSARIMQAGSLRAVSTAKFLPANT
jgi:acyl-coenzyme A thioesterase PaaI-like protein